MFTSADLSSIVSFDVITIFFFFSVGVASAIPKLELFMELVGAVCLSVMGLLLPAIVETVWRWGRDLGPCNWILWKNCLIGIFSIIAMVSGVAYSIISLLEHLWYAYSIYLNFTICKLTLLLSLIKLWIE